MTTLLPEREPAAWLENLGHGTEMGDLVRSHDWESTPLGHPDTWPSELRTAVRICLSSRFPMLVVWGPELIKIYNDGYRPVLGSEKHPGALGAPAREVWSEIWDQIGPLFDSVMRDGASTWTEHGLLVLERNGYPEECYFTWSYSPLHADDGSIAGALDVVTETTHEIVAERRLACVSAVSAAVIEAGQVTEVCRLAASALAGCTRDIRAADIYLLVGDDVTLVASNRADAVSPVDPRVVLAVSQGAPTVVIGGTPDSDMPAEHVVVRVAGREGGVDGVLVATLSPRRPFDAEYRSFVDLVAATIGAALDSAYRRSVAVDEYRAISETLQQAMLRPSSDLPTVAARYLPAVGGLSVGGDWYDVIDIDDHRRAIVVGDCVGHGLEAATAMGQLRSATRAMLLEDDDPAATLERLDRFADSTPLAFGATMVCAVVDRVSHTMTYAIAGHPPPLLVGPEGARWLDGIGGLPLAVDLSIPRRSATVDLRAHDIVVLYSDGLVERREESIDVGLERLHQAATSLHGRPIHAIADELLRRTLGPDRSDDVVLVVKQLDI